MNKGCVLITGIGGFIGQNVAEYFRKNGMDVIGIFHNTKPTIHCSELFFCDLSNESIDEYLEYKGKVDAIIHFAGQMTGNKIRDYLDNTIG